MAKQKKFGEYTDDDEVSESDRTEIIADGQHMSGSGSSTRQMALSQARNDHSIVAHADKPIKGQMQAAARHKLERTTAPVAPSALMAAPTVKELKIPDQLHPPKAQAHKHPTHKATMTTKPKQGRGLRALGSQLAAETASTVGGKKHAMPTRSSVSVASDD